MSRPQELRPMRWSLAAPAPADILAEMGQQHPILAQILYNRRIIKPGQIAAFLEGHYPRSEDPFLLPDMERAVARIQQAIERDEMIVVYGDFDADGVTATVLLVEALRGLGLDRRQAQPYIPDRVDEGYGLNAEALTELRQRGAGLVITVDCGVRAFREAEHAQEIGLDLIITDHHSLGSRLPVAEAIVNPKRSESGYPESRLAGVGIAYKLAQALRLSWPERARFEDAQLLDLVALGTVADLAPLLGENRKLVIEGLKVINSYRRPGIQALAEIARLKRGQITAESIAFGLGPRINAAGRLAHAYDAARLLAVNNAIMARDFARQLDQLNQERQRLTRRLSRLAEELVAPEEPLLFAADSNFASGVVGLVASRLAEKHYRPTIIVEQGEEESRGSCRSIEEFHITAALDQVEELLVRHGGHAQAAGFTIATKDLARFAEEMTAIAGQQLDVDELAPTLEIDAEISIDEIDWALHDVLAQLEPTGQANATPRLMSSDVHVFSHRAVGQDGSHLQLFVGSERVKLPAIAFRQGAWAGQLPERVDLVYTLNINEWNGRRDLQLMVQDIRPAGNHGEEQTTK